MFERLIAECSARIREAHRSEADEFERIKQDEQEQSELAGEIRSVCLKRGNWLTVPRIIALGRALENGWQPGRGDPQFIPGPVTEEEYREAVLMLEIRFMEYARKAPIGHA